MVRLNAICSNLWSRDALFACKLGEILNISFEIPAVAIRIHVFEFKYSTQNRLSRYGWHLVQTYSICDLRMVPKVDTIRPAFHSKSFNRHSARADVFILWIGFNIEIEIVLAGGLVIFM